MNEQKTKKNTLVKAGALAAASALIISVPANAQDADPVTDVNNMVTSIGTITAGVTTVVIAALTVRLAVKQVNRLMTKG